MAKRHNDANIIAFGAKVVEPEMVKKLILIWLEAQVEEGRHQRRIDLMEED